MINEHRDRSRRLAGQLHVIEPGGSGGVYEHARSVARGVADAGLDTVFHTTSDADGPFGAAEVCRCVVWPRRDCRLRQVRFLLRYTLLTIPHLVRRTRRGDIAHFHGHFRLVLTLPTIALLTLRRAHVVFSPHNTFVRTGRRFSLTLLRDAVRLAADNVVYSQTDREAVRTLGGSATVLDLYADSEPPSPDLVARWRARLGPGLIVTMPGFLRPDKDTRDFCSALSSLDGARGWIIGEDHGGLTEALRNAAATNGAVDVLCEYLNRNEFNAVVAASDVVVCAYRQASQSAVLRLARSFGVTSVATRIGGLGELATITYDLGDSTALGEAIVAAAKRTAKPAPCEVDGSSVEEYVRYYRVIVGRPSHPLTESVLGLSRSMPPRRRSAKSGPSPE